MEGGPQMWATINEDHLDRIRCSFENNLIWLKEL